MEKKELVRETRDERLIRILIYLCLRERERLSFFFTILRWVVAVLVFFLARTGSDQARTIQRGFCF